MEERLTMTRKTYSSPSIQVFSAREVVDALGYAVAKVYGELGGPAED
jgi:hypothetical protein